MDSSEDNATSHVRKRHQNQKWPQSPKKPPSSYNFFVYNESEKIMRNNPGMDLKEISSPTGKMFKALSETKKEKHIELARVAREKYERQVEEYKKWNALSKEKIKVCQERVVDMKREYITKLSAYLAKLPAEIRQQEIADCLLDAMGINKKKGAETNNSSASSNRSLRKSSSTAVDSSVDSDHMVDSDQSVDSDDCDDVTPSSAKESSEKSRNESDSEVDQSIPRANAIQREEDSNDEDESDSSEEESSFMASSFKAKNKLALRGKTTSTAVDSSELSDFDDSTKLSTYHSKFSTEKRQLEAAKCLPINASNAGMKRKRGAKTDKSAASSKKLKPTFIGEIDSDWSEEEEPMTLPIVGSKKKASIKQDPSRTSSSDDDQQESNRSSSSSSKSGKSTAPSETVRSAIHYGEDTSDEEESNSCKDEEESNDSVLYKKTKPAFSSENDYSDSSEKEEESWTLKKFGSNKRADQVMGFGNDSSSDYSDDLTLPKKRQISTRKSAEESSEDSSDESELSNLSNLGDSMLAAMKFSIYLAKLLNDKRRAAIKRKKRAETDDESSASSKKSFTDQNDSDSSEKEKLLTPSIVRNSRFDYDNSDNSEDETLPKKNLISLSKWVQESSENSSEESCTEPEQSKPLERSDSMLVAKSSSTGKDPSVRPLWALHCTKMSLQSHPTEWYAFEISNVSNTPEEEKKDSWNELSEKKKKRLRVEHTKRLKEYEEKLQAFQKGLSKTELQAFKHLKRFQRAVSEDASD